MHSSYLLNFHKFEPIIGHSLTIQKLRESSGKFVFQGLFFYVYIERPNPKKNQMAPHHGPQTPSAENPNPKNPLQEPQLQSANPQTTIYEIENNLGEKYSNPAWSMVEWTPIMQPESYYTHIMESDILLCLPLHLYKPLVCTVSLATAFFLNLSFAFSILS